MSDLSLIGRDYFVIEKLAKRLHDTVRRYHNFGPVTAEHRGQFFDVELLDDQHQPTGHVARVTVALLSVDPLGIQKDAERAGIVGDAA